MITETPPKQPQLLADGFVYAEAPRWYRDRLYVSDVHDRRIKSVGLEGDVEIVAEVPGRPSGLGFLETGELLVAIAEDRVLARIQDGVAETIVDLSPYTDGLLNDMVVGPSGRCYIGAPGFNLLTESPRPGRILLVESGREPVVVSSEPMFPNGMAITGDGAELVVAETAAGRVSRFEIFDDGTLGRRRTWAHLSSGPDGICLDSGGGAWAALLTEGRFVHINAAGVVDESITSHGNFAVACVSFGADRDRLALCSASSTRELLAQGDAVSRIEYVPIETVGAGVP